MPIALEDAAEAWEAGARHSRSTLPFHPVLTESCPQVLLCASSQSSSLVECWSLRKEGLPVNNIFQQISPVGESARGREPPGVR